jgi:acetyl-CoA C-acetyltransferase
VITLNDVYIIGAGETKFGELWERSLRELATEAGLRAIESAGIYSRDVEVLYGSNTLGGAINAQNDIGGLISDFAGLAHNNIPAISVEASTASGGAAVREAYLGIRSGEYNVAAVGGVEKLTDLYGSEVLDLTSTLLDSEWEGFFGATPAAIAALVAQKYMKDFKNVLTVEGAVSSTMVAEPLGMMDCSPASDGAAAIILASEEYVKKNKIHGIRILASAVAQDYLALHSRKSIYRFDSTVVAARNAYKKSGLKPDDISFAEIHDSYSIYGLIELEDLGFAKKGEAKSLLPDDIKLDGRIPINPSGGLKAKGNPFGATGVGQFVEAFQQLNGKAKERQVKSPANALLHSMAVSGSTSVVHILEGN